MQASTHSHALHIGSIQYIAAWERAPEYADVSKFIGSLNVLRI